MAEGSAAKQAAMLIALSPKSTGKGDSDEEPAPKDDESMDSAAISDMWDAIQSKDKTAFGDALKRYVQLCMSDEGPDSERS
jgi:hypothetical protein